MTEPATPDDLFERLDGLDISYKTIKHPPLFTVEDSKALRGELDGGHAKNLFLKNKKGRMWLLVAEESAPLNLKAFAKIIGAGNLSFGKPELLMDTLGVIPGAVTPFALINAEPGSVTLLFDQDLLAEDTLNFHPLRNTMTTSIAQADLLRFIEALGHNYEKVDLKAI